MTITPTKIINMITYFFYIFENITIRLYVIYIFNRHNKVRTNKMIYTIQFTNLFYA